MTGARWAGRWAYWSRTAPVRAIFVAAGVPARRTRSEVAPPPIENGQPPRGAKICRKKYRWRTAPNRFFVVDLLSRLASMTHRFACALLLLPMLLPVIRAADSVATPPPPAAFLRPGEVLELRMSYGIFGNAGTTRIETTREELEGLPQYRIKVTTRSRGVVDAIYPVTNDSESLLDFTTGRPLQIHIEGKAGSRPEKTTTVFDYTKGEVVHTDLVRPAKNTTAALPPEPAYDLMVAMLQARAWGLKPGESRRVLCANNADFYLIELTAVADERISTPAGEFDTVVLVPKQLGELKGFFKRGGSMKVWISKGEHPQLVRLDTRAKFGTVTAVLTRSEIVEPQPPAAVAAVKPAAPAR